LFPTLLDRDNLCAVHRWCHQRRGQPRLGANTTTIRVVLDIPDRCTLPQGQRVGSRCCDEGVPSRGTGCAHTYEGSLFELETPSRVACVLAQGAGCDGASARKPLVHLGLPRSRCLRLRVVVSGWLDVGDRPGWSLWRSDRLTHLCHSGQCFRSAVRKQWNRWRSRWMRAQPQPAQPSPSGVLAPPACDRGQRVRRGRGCGRARQRLAVPRRLDLVPEGTPRRVRNASIRRRTCVRGGRGRRRPASPRSWS